MQLSDYNLSETFFPQNINLIHISNFKSLGTINEEAKKKRGKSTQTLRPTSNISI